MQIGTKPESYEKWEVWEKYKTHMCKHSAYCEEVFFWAVSLCYNVSFGIFSVSMDADCPLRASMLDCYDNGSHLLTGREDVPRRAVEHICVLNTVCKTPSSDLSHFKHFTLSKRGDELDEWVQKQRTQACQDKQVW